MAMLTLVSSAVGVVAVLDPCYARLGLVGGGLCDNRAGDRAGLPACPRKAEEECHSQCAEKFYRL